MQNHNLYKAPVVERMLEEQRKKTIKECVSTYTMVIIEALIGEGITDHNQLIRIIQNADSLFANVITGTITREDIIADIKKNTLIDLEVEVT